MRLKILSLIFVVLFAVPYTECYALGISAHSAVVIDSLTGDVIYEKNAYERRRMASTTKIMTAICALENGNPDDMVKVHPSAVGVEGSSMYLGHGEVISLRDLTYGLMLASGNDAAVAIAMHISGSIEAFADLMNTTAAKIGAKDTSFKNPNGLDAEGHYTTAYDLAKITRYGMTIPAFAEIVSTKNVKIPWQDRDYPRQLKNHNKLLNMYEGCDGVKTGFTKKSGRCLVSSATKEGYQVIAVTLNAPDDWNDHISMLNYAFENYENRQLLKENDYLATIPIINGVTDTVEIIAEKGFSMPAKNGTVPEVEMKYTLPETLTAPVGFGQEVGKVDFFYKGNLIGTVAAVSNGSVAYCEPETILNSLRKIFKSFFLMYRMTC